MSRLFLTLIDEFTGKTIVREINPLAETVTDLTGMKREAQRWIDERGNEQCDTLLSLVHVIRGDNESVCRTYQALAALGAH